MFRVKVLKGHFCKDAMQKKSGVIRMSIQRVKRRPAIHAMSNRKVQGKCIWILCFRFLGRPGLVPSYKLILDSRGHGLILVCIRRRCLFGRMEFVNRHLDVRGCLDPEVRLESRGR